MRVSLKYNILLVSFKNINVNAKYKHHRTNEMLELETCEIYACTQHCMTSGGSDEFKESKRGYVGFGNGMQVGHKISLHHFGGKNGQIVML